MNSQDLVTSSASAGVGECVCPNQTRLRHGNGANEESINFLIRV
ncbi:MAG: hypothetical protein ACI9G1_001884 [Pirellulaceae bacterium]|jgi:hypothetical protein